MQIEVVCEVRTWFTFVYSSCNLWHEFPRVSSFIWREELGLGLFPGNIRTWKGIINRRVGGKMHRGCLHNLYSSPNIVKEMKGRTRWVGHVAQASEAIGWRYLRPGCWGEYLEPRIERKELRRLAPAARLAHGLILFASIRLASHVERMLKEITPI
jgi:hypothetical protein